MATLLFSDSCLLSCYLCSTLRGNALILETQKFSRRCFSSNTFRLDPIKLYASTPKVPSAKIMN
jgi:hypothetical protein